MPLSSFLACSLSSRKKDKWAEKAVENEDKDIQNDLHQAEVANGRASEHDQKAHEIKADAQKEAENVRKTNDILNRWRRS